MFGDLGHGLLMFLFAAFLVMREKPLAAKKSDNEVSNKKKTYITENLFYIICFRCGIFSLLDVTLYF